MIKFRQKDFSKFDSLKKMTRTVDEIPAVKTAILLSGPALGVANLSLNTSRKKKDTELRKEQTKAIEELTAAIESSPETSTKIKKSSKKIQTTFRKKHPEDVDDKNCIVLPNPVSKLGKKK